MKISFFFLSKRAVSDKQTSRILSADKRLSSMAGNLPIRRIRPICPIRLIRLTASKLPLSLQKAVF